MRDEPAPADSTAFDRFVEPLDPPLIILTTVHDGERSGCVIGFHAQCSIEPRRYAIWLSKANHTFGVALHAELFAVHVVDQAHRQLAELFGGTTGDEVDKFDRCSWTPGPGGVPLLDDLADRLVGRRVVWMDDGSDHACLTLEPIRIDVTEPPPVIRASELAHLRPGHEADEPT
jgi:flavin reductase (DIM6/NTAB) family NADH-FMN oxidoreductase RutF